MLLSMLGEYVVRTLNAVSAVTTYHVVRAGLRSDGADSPARAGRGRPAVRDDVPRCRARRPPGDHPGPARRGPSRRCSATRSSPRAARRRTTRLASPTPATSGCSATRAPATSRTPRHAARAAAVLGDAPRRGGAARPGAARGVATGGSAPTTASRPATLEEALRADLDGARPTVGPGHDLGLAVRLRPARPLRRPPPAVDVDASPTRRTCCSWRSCWPTRRSLTGLYGAARRRPRAHARSPRASPSTRAQPTPTCIERGVAGHSGGVLRDEQRRPGRPPRQDAAVVTDDKEPCMEPELPDVPFNLPAVEGRELDYVQDAVRGGHLASGGDVHPARRRAAARPRPAPPRC